MTNLLACYEMPYSQVRACVVYILAGILQFSPHETFLFSHLRDHYDGHMISTHNAWGLGVSSFIFGSKTC